MVVVVGMSEVVPWNKDVHGRVLRRDGVHGEEVASERMASGDGRAGMPHAWTVVENVRVTRI